MGCTGSKPSKKQKKNKKSGKRKGGDDDDFNDEDGEPIVILDAKPEQLRKEITKVWKAINEKRDALKKDIKPWLYERRGINAMLEEEKQKLERLLRQKDELWTQRETLMAYTWNNDADEVFRAYETKDKATQIAIFGGRTKWQLEIIGELYKAKHNEEIYERLVTDGQTAVGKFLTGSQTNLCKLLVYRLMPQPERDAAFLKDFTSGMSIQDENMMEVIMTRPNAELKAALDYFLQEYGTSLRAAFGSHSYKNYREFVGEVLKCKKDETDTPFDDATAEALATELYEAGAGRSVGIDPKPFIRIFSMINKDQFDSINAKYRNQPLLKDIDSKLGGDFAMAIKIRCMDKYEYLADRIEEAFKSFTKDKDLLCRVLGSVRKWECVKIREAFDRPDDKGRPKSLEALLKTNCSSEPNFLKACLTLISGDMINSPLGSDREAGEDEADVTNAGNRQRKHVEDNYKRKEVFARGEQIWREQRAQKRAAGGAAFSMGGDEDDDDDIPSFDRDARSRTDDVIALSAALKDAEVVMQDLSRLKETVKDEIFASKQAYFAIYSHCYETETWIGILRSHVKSLKEFNDRRDRAQAVSGIIKGGKSTKVV